MELAPAIPSEEEEDEVNALGWSTAAIAPCKGKSIDTKGKSMDAKPMYSNAFALAGRTSSLHHTQGDDFVFLLLARYSWSKLHSTLAPSSVALGYALAGPSARSLNACQLQVNNCETLLNNLQIIYLQRYDFLLSSPCMVRYFHQTSPTSNSENHQHHSTGTAHHRHNIVHIWVPYIRFIRLWS